MPKEAPIHMLVAMGIAAFLCIYFAVDYKTLYSLLPFQAEAGYVPYTGAHVIGHLQLLMFGALAFILMYRSGFLPAEIKAQNLDTDWFYRKGARLFFVITDKTANGINTLCDTFLAKKLTGRINAFAQNVPATLVFLFLSPFKGLLVSGGDDGMPFRQRINRAVETGAIPVGISAAVATLFIVILFVLNGSF